MPEQEGTENFAAPVPVEPEAQVVDPPEGAIIFPFGTEPEWQQQNPILIDGQMGVSFDPVTGIPKLKVGYQGKAWTDLPYVALGSQMMMWSQGQAVLETIPAPQEPGYVFLSLSMGGVGWFAPDPGTFRNPTVFTPKVMREQLGAGIGPPNSLTEGVLAVNVNGHATGDRRPSLYIGDQMNAPILIFSAGDLMLELKVKSLGLSGGQNVADALNLWPTPLVVASSELWVVVYETDSYLFSGAPGRYGGVNYSGEGGPGQAVSPSQFVWLSRNRVTATVNQIVGATGPQASVVADDNLRLAIYQLLGTYGVSQVGTPINPGRPILTNASGKLDRSFIQGSTAGVDYQGGFTPKGQSLESEYPAPTAEDQMWVISQVGDLGYEFAKGDCKDLTCHNGDQLIWNGAIWDLVQLVNITGTVKVDGSAPMVGNLLMGGNEVTNAGAFRCSPAAYAEALVNYGRTAEGLILDGGTF